MDLKGYYRRLREIEDGIAAQYVVLVSLPTPDGGKPGVRTEATRHVAAKMIVGGTARMATPEEAQEFAEETAQTKLVADQVIAASRMQVIVMPAPDARAVKTPRTPKE